MMSRPMRDEDQYASAKRKKVDYHPTAQELKDIKLAHDNCGHPQNVDYVRMLRFGGVRPEVCDWVRDHFRCDECEGHKLPKARRPTAVPRSYRFNHVVGVDLVEIKFKEQAYFWLNIICWGDAVPASNADRRRSP